MAHQLPIYRCQPAFAPSAPVQRRLQSPPAKRKFLAVSHSMPNTSIPNLNSSVDPWDSRIYYMDNLRAVAMFLGLVIHAAVFYNSWPLPAGKFHFENSGILHLTVEMIHVFRMELFFLVAGFFACLYATRKSLRQLVRNRTIRILVPFVCCFFLLQPCWSAINVVMFTGGGEGFWELYFKHFVDPLTIVRYEFPVGQWFQHLWFLQLLILFIAAQVILTWIGTKFGFIAKIVGAIQATFERRLGIFVMILVSYFTLLLCPPWADVPNIGSPLNIVAYYGWFYFIGFFIFRCPAILDNALQNVRSNLIPVVIGLAVVISSVSLLQLSAPVEILRQDWSLFKGTTTDGQIEWSFPFLSNKYNFTGFTRGDLKWHAFSFLKAYTTWFTVFAFIYFFKSFLNRRNPIWQYLSQSSYWAYIIHFPLQFILYHYIFSGNVESPILGFLGILFVSIVICMVSYHLLVRSTVVGVILNGKRISLNLAEETNELKNILQPKLILAGLVGLLVCWLANTLERDKDYRLTQYALWKEPTKVEGFIKQNPGEAVSIRRSDGRNSLHLCAATFPADTSLQAPIRNTSTIIDTLIHEGLGIDSTDLTGQTPLHYAVRTGNLEAVRSLCGHGANPNHPAKWQRSTPLQLAAVLGNDEILIELLNHGGDADREQSRGENARELYQEFHGKKWSFFPKIKLTN